MLTTTAEASAAAELSGSQWIDMAHGRATGLQQLLGEPEEGHFLPGLGVLQGWGLVTGSISGALLTGFDPKPEAVSILLSGRFGGGLLGLESLACLRDLPKSCLREFGMRSFLREGACLLVADRGVTVVETASRQAADLAASLVRHLVVDAQVEILNGYSSEKNAAFVRVEGSTVIDFRESRDRKSAPWLPVLDWAGG
jgi:hypothetical protein